MKIADDLYSDAMDAAMTAFVTQNYLQRGQTNDGETMMRRKLAAAIEAYLAENPVRKPGEAGAPMLVPASMKGE